MCLCEPLKEKSAKERKEKEKPQKTKLKNSPHRALPLSEPPAQRLRVKPQPRLRVRVPSASQSVPAAERTRALEQLHPRARRRRHRARPPAEGGGSEVAARGASSLAPTAAAAAAPAVEVHRRRGVFQRGAAKARIPVGAPGKPARGPAPSAAAGAEAEPDAPELPAGRGVRGGGQRGAVDDDVGVEEGLGRGAGRQGAPGAADLAIF